METIEALRRSKLLAALDDEQLTGLAGMARQRSFGAGQTLIEEGGTRGSAMYVVVEGAVEVRSGDRVLAELGPGEAVGELALVSNAPRTADVVAVEDTTVVVLAKWDFMPYLRSNPDVAVAVVEELADRLHEANAKLAGA